MNRDQQADPSCFPSSGLRPSLPNHFQDSVVWTLSSHDAKGVGGSRRFRIFCCVGYQTIPSAAVTAVELTAPGSPRFTFPCVRSERGQMLGYFCSCGAVASNRWNPSAALRCWQWGRDPQSVSMGQLFCHIQAMTVFQRLKQNVRKLCWRVGRGQRNLQLPYV